MAGLLWFFQQLVKIFLVGLYGSVIPSVQAVPDVIDPNENAYEIGPEIEAIRFQRSAN